MANVATEPQLGKLNKEIDALEPKIEAAWEAYAALGQDDRRLDVFKQRYDDLVAYRDKLQAERAPLSAGAGPSGAGGESAGLKRTREEEEQLMAGRQVMQRTAETNATNARFFKAMKAPEKAPTTISKLEVMLAGHEGGLIPVTQDFFNDMRQMGLAEAEYLFAGRGPVADHMTATLRILAATTAGETEQDTTVQVTGQLFKIMYRSVDTFLPSDSALFARIRLNASVSKATKSTLLSPVEVLKRPDTVVMSKRKVSLFVVEDKQADHGADAAADLIEYLCGGLPPGYQQIPCIPVATAAGCDVKFGLCDVQGRVSLMTNAIAVNSLGGAIRAVAASLQVYRIMLNLNDLAPLELMDMGLGGTVERDNGCTLEFGSRKIGVIKTIKNFESYSTQFGVTFEDIKGAYGVQSPFLPLIKSLPTLTTTRHGHGGTYKLQMMTFGQKLNMVDLTEAEAARCVYACLSVASKLHAGGICAADFRWPNIMKQQQRALPEGAAPNHAYADLEWTPLVIDLEQARKPGLEPATWLRDWTDGTLQDKRYVSTSDVYQIGVMLEQWQHAHPSCSANVSACVEMLKSHQHSAAHIAETCAWLAAAHSVFSGLL